MGHAMSLRMLTCTLTADHESQLWLRWRRDLDTEARAELMDSYLAYSRIIAAKLYRTRYTDEFEFHDYAQFAAIGMLEAMESFDPDRQVTFRTFSSRRIHGAVLDGIHASSEVHRQIWARKALLADRSDCLLQNESTSQKTSETFLGLVEVAISLALGYMLDGSGMYRDDEHGPSQDNSYERAELRQLQFKLVSLLEGLPPRERVVIRAHYFNQIQFKDIAKSLGVSKVRVCQLHRQALDRLYRNMVVLRLTDMAA